MNLELAEFLAYTEFYGRDNVSLRPSNHTRFILNEHVLGTRYRKILQKRGCKPKSVQGSCWCAYEGIRPDFESQPKRSRETRFLWCFLSSCDQMSLRLANSNSEKSIEMDCEDTLEWGMYVHLLSWNVFKHYSVF